MKHIPVFPAATGGVMLHTNMELRALLVQLAMLEAAETISATKVPTQLAVVILLFTLLKCALCV